MLNHVGWTEPVLVGDHWRFLWIQQCSVALQATRKSILIGSGILLRHVKKRAFRRMRRSALCREFQLTI
jgi:hypothetical protein